MYEKIEKCPTCNHTEFNSYLIADDHTVSKESFAIMQCANCQLLLTNPRPTIENIGRYYQSDKYVSHSNKANTFVNFIYKIARSFTLRQKNKLLRSLTDKRKLLDFGCGAGVLIQYLSQKGWDASGLEPDPNTRKQLQEESSLPIYDSLSNLPSSKFDVITAWHVIEHVHDLTDTLSRLRKLLKKSGSFIVAVPNHESFDRTHYQENWAAYDVPRHLYHFNQETIIELMKFHGFKLSQTLPMKLDAYYVSLLSEKIKTGKPNFIKAILTGFKSNRYAIKNNHNYSSLIYVFKKS